jgi:hypothetical protein
MHRADFRRGPLFFRAEPKHGQHQPPGLVLPHPSFPSAAAGGEAHRQPTRHCPKFPAAESDTYTHMLDERATPSPPRRQRREPWNEAWNWSCSPCPVRERQRITYPPLARMRARRAIAGIIRARKPIRGRDGEREQHMHWVTRIAAGTARPGRARARHRPPARGAISARVCAARTAEHPT